MDFITTAISSTLKRFATILMCFLISVFEGYDIQVIGFVGPSISHELGLGKAELGLIFGSTMIGLMLGAMSGGWLADRIGRRPTLAFGTLIFGLATVGTIWCFDATTFSIARGVTGFGIGAAMPNIMAIASDLSPPERRASSAMMMFCGMPVGAAIVGFLAKGFPEWSWQMFFWVGGVPPLILAPLILLLLPETAPTKSEAAELKALSVSNALFGGGRALTTLTLWIAFAFTLAMLYLLLNWLPTLLVEKGFSRAVIADAVIAFNVASVFGALALGMTVDRFGIRWSMALVFLALIGSFVGLAAGVEQTQVILFSAIAGACIVSSQFVLYGIAPSYYPANARGTGAGAAVSIGRLGAIAGPISAGLILSAGDGWDVVKYLTPVIVAAGLSVFLLSFFQRSGD